MAGPAPDVHRVGLGETTEGENSAYLLPERGVLVDPGPPTSDAWNRLREGVTAVCPLDRIDHVLVTHWHVDHAGLAPRLAEHADATVHLHEADAPLVGDYAAARQRRVSRDRERLRAWGVPEALVEVLVEGDTPSPMPDRFPVEELGDGDVVAGVECVHTPGHTKGHAVFEAVPEGGETGDGPLFVGDLVLPTYSPNVGGGDTRMENPLATYRDSLDRIVDRAGAGQQDRGPAYPGHGTPFPLRERVAEIREHHEERCENCRAVVADLGAATPWAVAEELFGEMPGIHAKMGAGEAYSHLAALAAEGELDLVGEEPLLYALP